MKEEKRGIFKKFIDYAERDLHQIYALTVKNITLQTRQYLSNICSIFTPIICMLFILILQIITDNLISSLSRFMPDSSEDSGVKYNSTLMELDTAVLIMQMSSMMNTSSDYGNYPTNILFNTTDTSEQFIPLINTTTNSIYTFLDGGSEEDIDLIFYNELEEADSIKNSSFDYWTALKIRDFSNGGIEVVFQFENDYIEGSQTTYCFLLGSTYMTGQYLPCEFLVGSGMINMVSSAFIQNQTGGYMDVETRVTQMEFYEETGSLFSLDIASILGLFFYPFIMMLVLPVIMHSIAVEKENEVKQVMKLMGMKERNYLLAMYAFEFVLCLISSAILYIMGLILSHRLFTQTSPLLLILLFIGSNFSIVSLSFFFASFITKGFIATIVGYLVAIFTPIAGIILNQYVLTEGNYVAKLLLFVPVFPITDIMYYFNAGCGDYSCLQPSAFAYNIDMDIAFIFLFINPIIYFLVSLYLEQVTPKPYGVRKGLFFFLEPIFKLFRKEKEIVVDIPENEDSDVKELRLNIQNKIIKPNENGIVVEGIVKKFGRGKKGKVAVKGVFFNVAKKECLGLLGPNGAGKTTTVNMLSGMFSQTKGEAFVNGYSISYDMDKVHNSIGLCPQFDVVWKDLTPREHLLFYSRLKGSNILKEYEEAGKILHKVGLLEEKDINPSFFKKIIQFFFPKEKKAKQLSGGMRRRLSIAISLCGNPDTLLLDEPTTGLDPRNRREIWDIIKEEKKNRSVILTTHSMEEADAISDRICIMCHGRVVCAGNSLHLKNKFGNGYLINIKYSTGERKKAVEFLREVLKDTNLEVVKEYANNISFESRPKNGKSFPISHAFENLEYHKKENGILDFEIIQSTLEDVFLNVIKKEEEKLIKRNISTRELKDLKDGTRVIQVKPKNYYEGSFKGDNCEIIIEDSSIKLENQKIIKISEIDSFTKNEEDTKNNLIKYEVNVNGEEYVIAVKIEESDEFEKKVQNKLKELNSSNGEKNVKDEEVIIEVEKPKDSLFYDKLEIPSFGEKIVDYLKRFFSQTVFLLWKNFLLSIRGWKVTVLEVFSPFLVIALFFILSLVATIITEDHYIHPTIYSIEKNVIECKSWGIDCYSFVYSTNKNEFADRIMDDIIEHLEIPDDYYLEFEYEGEMIDFMYANPNTTVSAISFSNITKKSYTFGELVFYTDDNVTTYNLYFNATGDTTHQHFNLQTIIDNTIYYLSMGDIGKEVERDTFNYSRQGYPQILSSTAVSGQNALFSSTGPLFFSLIGMIIFVVCTYQIVVEKEQHLRSGLELVGLNKLAYFFSWFLTFSIISFLTTSVTLISGYIFQLEVVLYCNPLLMFLLLFVYNLSLVAFSFAMSSLFQTGKVAIISGFIVVGIAFILNFFLANGSLIYLLFELEDGYEFVYILFQIFYPPFNFGKMFTDIVNKALKVYNSETNSYELNEGYSFRQFVNPNVVENILGDYENQASFYSILYLCENFLLFMLVFLYLDVVVPRDNYPGAVPWFFLLPSFWGCGKKKVESVSKEVLSAMDEDLKREYQEAHDDNTVKAVKVVNGKKTYKMLLRKGTQALKGVSFTSDAGTCLGLLGDNGAGKSTTIGILSGIVPISSGDMKVLEASVSRHRGTIRNNMGVTLQDNILWNDLTAADHIRLYAQMKGLGWKMTKREVELRLKEVGLYDVRNDRSKTYSGGMKRRLCVAIGYVAEKKLILLDEPTTGLDPSSKRDVWDLIQKKKKNCSTILTTHSMEEADTLSNKIIIMKKGKIVCSGDGLHLKSKFNSGYVLKFISLEEKESEMESFIDEKFPNAVLVTKNAGNFIYNISKKHFREMIKGLECVEKEMEKETMFKDFGISHSTLEDVYLKVNKDDFVYEVQEDIEMETEKEEIQQKKEEIMIKNVEKEIIEEEEEEKEKDESSDSSSESEKKEKEDSSESGSEKSDNSKESEESEKDESEDESES